MEYIEFTREKYLKLKREYNKAVAQGKSRFDFEGHPVLVAYAKYLIQYLEMKFK